MVPGEIGMMAGLQVQAMTGERPFCPQCDGVELRRQGRIGFWQRTVMPYFGLFPWECGLCRKVYMLRQRSVGYRQHPSETSLVPKHLAPVPVSGRIPSAVHASSRGKA